MGLDMQPVGMLDESETRDFYGVVDGEALYYRLQLAVSSQYLANHVLDLVAVDVNQSSATNSTTHQFIFLHTTALAFGDSCQLSHDIMLYEVV